MDKTKTTELDNVVVRFSGDSGDGMQLTGTLLTSAQRMLNCILQRVNSNYTVLYVKW